jgi:hypothetical protein
MHEFTRSAVTDQPALYDRYQSPWPCPDEQQYLSEKQTDALRSEHYRWWRYALIPRVANSAQSDQFELPGVLVTEGDKHKQQVNSMI